MFCPVKFTRLKFCPFQVLPLPSYAPSKFWPFQVLTLSSCARFRFQNWRLKMRATTNKQNLFGKREIICSHCLIIETLLAKTGSWKIAFFFLKILHAFLKNLFENHHPLFKNRLWPLSEKHFLPEILLPNVDFSRKFWRKKQNIRHFKTFHERFFKVSRFVHTVFKLLTLQNDFLSYFTID